MLLAKEITIKKLLFFDETGNLVKEYYDSQRFDFLWVAKKHKDGKYGLISNEGKELTDFIYDDYKSGIFWNRCKVCQLYEVERAIDGYLIRIDESGEKFYTIFTGFSKKVSDDEFSEVNFIINDNYDELLSFAIIKKDDKYGVIHGSGKIVIPCEYVVIEYNSRSEELIIIEQSGEIQRLNLHQVVEMFKQRLML